MLKKVLVGSLVCALILGVVGCGPTLKFATPLKIGISRHPATANYGRGVLERLPSYDPKSRNYWQVDIRGCDLSSLALGGRLNDLLHSDFDSVTKWPDTLPEGFEPDEVMELAKDPGLGVRVLHEQGITGKGVGIAIIDQTLLVDHIEYKDRLIHYEEIHNKLLNSAMHGAAVASIAVGKTVGVAPEADLYYIAESHAPENYDFTRQAKCVDRIVEINDSLPQASKIRVLSMSIDWSQDRKGYAEVVAAVERAKAAGIFVVSASLYETYNQTMFFSGLGRTPYADPNDPESYGPGASWSQTFFSGSFDREALLFPMDARCTASPTGESDYVFYSRGGVSWSIPYIAGLYALACQVKPDVTPDEFWEAGLSTGDQVVLTQSGQSMLLSKIINPEKLIRELSESR